MSGPTAVAARGPSEPGDSGAPVQESPENGVVVPVVASSSAAEGAEPTERASKPTPLPLAQMAPLSLVLLSEAIGTTMLLPFVGLFVTYLQGYSNTNAAGKTSGMLVGLFMLGQLISAKLWGYVSDTYGRRPPLLISTFAASVTMFFFGLSPNLFVCCVLRFIHGVFNGSTLVAKTVISDITDKSNEAKGFSFISLTWALGSLIGPAIGGMLYDPVTNKWLQWMHVTRGDFLGRNPAFIVCFVLTLCTITTFLSVFFFLRESNPYHKRLADSKGVRWLRTHLPFFTSATTATAVVVEASEAAGARTDSAAGQSAGGGAEMESGDPPARVRSTFAALAGEANPDRRLRGGSIPASPTAHTGDSSTNTAGTPHTVGAAASSPPQRKGLTYMQAARVIPIRNVTLLYALVAAADMTYSQILPLWAVAEKDVGGLGYLSDTAALILLCCSVPSLISNYVFSWMCGFFHHDYKKFWIFSMSICAVTTVAIPWANVFASDGARLTYIIFFGIMRQSCQSWGYSLVNMLTAKAAPLGCVGAVYGISQSCSCLVRCIVPFAVAPLFAMTVAKKRSFPINHHLLFLFAGLCCVVGVVLCMHLRITRTPHDDVIEAILFAPRKKSKKSRRASDGGMATEESEAGSSTRRADGKATRTPSSALAEMHSDTDTETDDDGLEETYFALVASFAGNPLGAGNVPMEELRRVNKEAHEETRGSEATTVATPSTATEADAVAVAASADQQSTISARISSPLHPHAAAHEHVVKATSRRLLSALQHQHVEGTRQADEAAEEIPLS